MARSFTRQVLVASFVFAIAMILVIGSLWLNSSSRIKAQLINMRDRYEISQFLYTMSDASRMRALSTHRMLIMDDIIERFEEQAAFSAHADRFLVARDALLSHPAFNEHDKKAWHEASKMVNDGAVLHNTVVNYLINEQDKNASQLLKRESKQVQDGFIHKFSEILAFKNQEVDQIVSDTEKMSQEFFDKLVMIALSSLVMIIAVFAYAYRYTITAENTLRHAHELEKNENEYKTEFLSRVSHELRTPLNAILGFAQVINMDKNNKLPKEHAMYFKHIEQSGWQLLSLVDNILDITMICEGRVSLNISNVNLRDLINTSVTSFGDMAAEHKVRIDVDLQNLHVETIESDNARLSQVLQNLISNAIKYNLSEDGRVEVKVSQETYDGQIRIGVSNTGEGIQEENLNRLFKPFSKVGDASKEDGRGIGLVLTKALVECMNGVIGVKSEPGVKTLFWLELPLKYKEDSKNNTYFLSRIA